MRAGCAFPMRGSHQHFALFFAAFAVKLVNGHGAIVVSPVQISSQHQAKSEGRNPRSERKMLDWGARISDFFRISDFEFRIFQTGTPTLN
jgi:hypothetical protein